MLPADGAGEPPRLRGRRGKEQMFSTALTVFFFLLGAILVIRAVQGKYLFRFPIFYSYIVYMVVSGAIVTGLYLAGSAHYAVAWWFRYLLSLLVEFAVVVEISDHLFSPYPAIRQLGRVLVAGICVMFFFLYVLPSLLEVRPASVTILDLAKRTSVTKAAAIIILIAAARYYDLRLGKNIAGMLVGFSFYQAVNVANFALAEAYGRQFYAQTLSTVLRLSHTLCLLVWTVSLWRYEPVLQTDRELPETAEKVSEPLAVQLGRLDTALTRLFRK
jgi:hypothetical protein